MAIGDDGDFYENTWDNIDDSAMDDITDRSGLSENETYDMLHGMFEDYVDDDMSAGDQQQMWIDFLDAFVDPNGDMTMDEWFEEYDIDPADFDWDEWREAMGY